MIYLTWPFISINFQMAMTPKNMSFADWTFPHNCLLPDWSSQVVSGPPAASRPSSGFTEKILSRDNAYGFVLMQKSEYG
jgi:hypothetical protein